MKPLRILPFLLATALAATAVPPSGEAPPEGQRRARRHEPRPQKMRPPRGPGNGDALRSHDAGGGTLHLLVRLADGDAAELFAFAKLPV